MADTGYCPVCARIEVFEALRKSPMNLGTGKDREDQVIQARRYGGNPMRVRFACQREGHLVVGGWRA